MKNIKMSDYLKLIRSFISCQSEWVFKLDVVPLTTQSYICHLNI